MAKKSEIKQYILSFEGLERESRQAENIISRVGQELGQEEITFETIKLFRDLIVVRNKFQVMRFVLFKTDNNDYDKCLKIYEVADELIEQFKINLINMIYKIKRSSTVVKEVEQFIEYAGIAKEENLKNFFKKATQFRTDAPIKNRTIQKNKEK
jgi:hypothetical protein